jgi:hypothetical protein
VLGRKGSAVVLTSDHKASRDDEVQRVQVRQAVCSQCDRASSVVMFQLQSNHDHVTLHISFAKLLLISCFRVSYWLCTCQVCRLLAATCGKIG